MDVTELKVLKQQLEMDITNLVEVEVVKFIQKTGVGVKDITFQNHYRDDRREPVFMQAQVTLNLDLL